MESSALANSAKLYWNLKMSYDVPRRIGLHSIGIDKDALKSIMASYFESINILGN